MGEEIPDIGALLVVLCLPVVVWVLNQTWMRRLLRPFGLWLWSRLNPPAAPDVAALELWHALRRQRLLRDLERVRRLVADDAWMSATRQVGNRLAFEQLVAEIAELGPAPALPVVDPWTVATTSAPVTTLLAGPPSPSTPYVEILELGPPRRAGRRAR